MKWGTGFVNQKGYLDRNTKYFVGFVRTNER